MGTAIWEKRHYEALATILKDIKADRYTIYNICRKLQEGNKYFKPLLFLEKSGIRERDIKYYKEHYLINTNYTYSLTIPPKQQDL